MFDSARAKRVLNFFERVLRHPKMRGKPLFILLAWQIEILREVFGQINEAGLRIVRRVYVELPKKNGKSELAAGIALYMLIADGEAGAEVYSAATTQKQAALVFNVAAAMVEASPVLKSKLVVVRSRYTIYKRGDPESFYRAISADGDAQDGINPHCVIIDELHRWKTAKAFELFDVLTKGTVAREQPLVFEITTAGSTEDESPLAWQEHEYAENIKRGEFEDPTFRGWIFAAPREANWQDPETWRLANPSLESNGGFVPLSSIASECTKAIHSKARQPGFQRYHLGWWLSTEAEWMDPEVWRENAGELRRLIERPCYAGLDLASVEDLAALVLLFPDGDGSFDVLPFFWMAEERVRQRELEDHVPYGTWVQEGLIEASKGNVIDLRDIKKKLAWASEVFELREVAFDPHHAGQFSIELTDELGLKCVPIPQQYSHLSEPMKKVMALALEHLFRHGGNKVLNWNMRCLRSRADDKDNIKPVKPNRKKSTKRIDGAVALIIAMARAMFHRVSVYETRGLAGAR